VTTRRANSTTLLEALVQRVPYDATTTDPVDHIQGQGAACGFISANQGNQCTSTAVETWPYHSAASRTRQSGACSVSEVQFK
jgi:hypothetical protein